MGNLTGVNILRLAVTWISFAEGHQKLQKKMRFFTFGQFNRVFGIGTQIHVTAHVLRIPKMSYFLGVGVSKGELLGVKVNRLWKFGSVTKNKRRCKKTTLR